ncbi:MAG: hypothetical protein WBX25_12570 [Rhodomicrobium sp.]
MIKRAIMGSIAALLFVAGKAQAEDKEPSAVFEIGGAGEWGLQHGGSSFGPELAIEYTAIEQWLEIEAGVMPLFRSGQTELGTELLFKKPFELSDKVEFLIGGGPEWVHRSSDKPADSLVGEVMIEFVYSPWSERNVGFFIEPSYGYDFGKGHEQSLGVTGGLHIPLR